MDITWLGNEEVQGIIKDVNIPYIRIDLSISPFLKLLDKYLDQRNCTDVALIFNNPTRKIFINSINNCNMLNMFYSYILEVDQALYFWIDTQRTRMVITDTLDKVSAKKLKALRPIPNNYAIIGTTEDVVKLFQLVRIISSGLNYKTNIKIVKWLLYCTCL